MTPLIYSFDIFDTLVVRACGAPSVVFNILAARVLGDDATPEKKTAFALERVRALHRAESGISHPGDPSLAEIYDFADFSAFTSLPKDDIRRIEMDVESDMLVGVESMRKIVRDRRANGNPIYFTSDMYLPSDFLREILTREGFYKDGDMILVSCEQGATKRDGSLFRLLKQRTGANIIHYGDNRWSDCKMLKKSIKGSYKKISHRFSPYQQLIANQFDIQLSHRPQVLASISKAILISEKEQSGAVKFATDIVAPVLVPVVYQIMKRAVEDGKKKLFFFARDAKVMFNIAKALSPPLFPGLEIEYLYLSRTSFYVPSLPEISADSLGSMYDSIKHTGSSPEQFIKKYMPGLSLGEGYHFNSIEELCADKGALDKLVKYHATQRILLLEYLQEIGFASESDSVGGVDMSGSGKTFQYLNDFLVQKGYKPISGYAYFIWHIADLARAGEVRSVISMENLYGRYFKQTRLTPVIEDYIAATDDGRTTNYSRNTEGKVCPVFENEPPAIHKAHSDVYNLHKKICVRFAELFIACKGYSHNEYNISVAQWLLSEYATNPLKEYVLPLTNAIYDDGGLKEDSIVKKFTLMELIDYVKTRGKFGSWARGSVVATFGNLGRFALWSLSKLKNWYVNR